MTHYAFIRQTPFLLLALIPFSNPAQADELFSGPQVGERLAPFHGRGVLGDAEGKDLPIVAAEDGGPHCVVFVHKLTRPALALTRVVMDFAAEQKDPGVRGGVVFLTPDPTDTENWMRRAAHALPKQVPLVISEDGPEGPGAYGLNRNVTLTVLVGSAGKVTANFALVQPSVQVDALKIATAISQVTGSEPPSLAQLVPQRGRRMQMQEADPRLGTMLRKLIRKDATKKEVEAAVGEIEKFVADNKRARSQIGERASRIVQSGKIKNYGTSLAQTYLVKWAREWGPKEPSESKP